MAGSGIQIDIEMARLGDLKRLLLATRTSHDDKYSLLRNSESSCENLYLAMRDVEEPDRSDGRVAA